MAENETKEDEVIKSTPKRKKSVKKENTKPQYHVSVLGDTPYTISKKYNVTKEQIEQLNDLDWLNMKQGTSVRVK